MMNSKIFKRIIAATEIVDLKLVPFFNNQQISSNVDLPTTNN